MPEEGVELTTEQKIANIRNCTDYRQMAWDWFPPAHVDEYYFISYSHKDYKEVFEDIYALQSCGLHVWYDRELRPGKDWEIEARAHIYDFKCKGVIFYVSANSVISDSIHREIEFVKRSGKSYLSVNLPVEGEYLSASEILKKVQPEVDENSEKFNTLENTFSSKVTYLKLSEEAHARAERIKSALVSLPLLKFKIEKSESGDASSAIVIGINDINAAVITKEDFICRDENNKIVPVSHIGACAFANCRFLEKVELPENLGKIGCYSFYNCVSLKNIIIPDGVAEIDMYAFSGCISLTNINIPTRLYRIKPYAFMNCSSLESIELSVEMREISDSVFLGCTSLTSITIPDSVTTIGWHAFEDCTSLESITIPDSVTTIGWSAFKDCISLKYITISNNVTKISEKVFMGCTSLKSIGVCNDNSDYAIRDGIIYKKLKKRNFWLPRKNTIPNGVTEIDEFAFFRCTSLTNITIPDNVTQIGKIAFYGCTSLENITIPDSVTQIGSSVLSSCTKLQNIHYSGTVEEWNAIKKGEFWDSKTGEYVIYCKNGLIHKDGTVVKY